MRQCMIWTARVVDAYKTGGKPAARETFEAIRKENKREMKRDLTNAEFAVLQDMVRRQIPEAFADAPVTVRFRP